jgi:hypothetical protein
VKETLYKIIEALRDTQSTNSDEELKELEYS